MWTRRIARPAAAAALALALATAPALADRPLSAIDWLSRSVAVEPPAVRTPAAPADGSGLAPDAISVSPLSDPSSDATGLLPAERSGLARDFWGDTGAARVAADIRALDTGNLPALRELTLTILLSELDPPTGGDSDQGMYFLARIDKLLDFGALDQAMAMIELVDTGDPEVFRRWFDIALLLGQEQRPCEVLRAQPRLEPSYPARVFCIARGGDWSAAVVTLRSAEALGQLSAEEEEVLARFLDPDLFEDAGPMPPLSRPSPLQWRMMEAIGEPPPTRSLPLAFAQADLRRNSGWKAQIEAAERLTRAGALSPNRLLGLYTERVPAASGGVWDRVAAVQALDAALTDGDADAVDRALPEAWRQMAQVELETVLSRLHAERLQRLSLQEKSDALAFRAGLLSEDFEAVADRRDPGDSSERFLVALALGNLEPRTPAPGTMGEAVRDGFTAPLRARDNDDEAQGMTVMGAIASLEAGAAGDMRGVTDGIAALRETGLDRIARRAALELMLLDRRG